MAYTRYSIYAVARNKANSFSSSNKSFTVTQRLGLVLS